VKITVNGSCKEVAERTTVAALLQQFNLSPQRLAVEVNRELVPRNRHETHVLSENDIIEIVTLVGGG
jgi:sulfur carrier protein